MAVPAERSAEAASSALAGRDRIAVHPTVAASSSDDSFPTVGACWRGKYNIDSANELAGVATWTGTCAEGRTPVLLRAVRAPEPDIRAQVWAKLGGIDSPHLQRARDAQRVGEFRVEVADLPRGVPLAKWRAGRETVAPDVIKNIVGQLAEALAALHAFELVHLGLSPESVFILDDAATLHCTVAGLDALTTFDQKQPIAAAVDPFYAPPEASGLHVHVAGPGLCAWDWWSLGRIAQELVLGRHIVSYLANGGAANLRQRAEELLHEADVKGPRAGAVEQTPSLDPGLRVLLRGLLTSAKDARWTGDNVDRWIRGLPVKEHYDTPRAETHFRWRGRPWTVPEMAALLQSAEHWADNSVQLFEQTTPGTLAHFLRWSQTQAVAHEQLASALELADALPLKLSSPTAQREAVTMVALLQLSAGRLVWRGRTFDSTTVAAMMQELGEADALMILRALTTRSTALQIERIDAEGGRLLTELGRTTGDVEGMLRRYGWLAANDTQGAARLFRLSLEPIATLRTSRDALTQGFAGSDHPPVEKLFKAQNVSRADLVALAWMASTPEKFKFYTHAEAARRRAEALRTRGVELTNALTWAQLERALNSGRPVIAGWGWFILAWFAIAVTSAVLWPGWRGLAFGLVPLVLALLLRIIAAPRAKRGLREFLPDAQWSWRDGPGRCRRELRLAGHGVAASALTAELEGAVNELASLSQVQPTPAPLPVLPRFGAVRLFGALGWGLVIACVGAAGARVYLHPPSAKELKAAWVPAVDPAKPAKPASNLAKKSTAEEKDADIKVSWPFKAEDNPVTLAVRAAESATSEQISYATKHGRELVAPYRADTINTLIVMPVPAGDDAAVMLFDGKRGELANQQVYRLEFRPIPRTWVELSGRKGVYLDR